MKSLKLFLLALTAITSLFASSAFAEEYEETYSAIETIAGTTYVTGTGWISGMCNGATSMMCIRGLQNQAEYKAKWDAQRSCQLQNGNPLNYTAICNSRCAPSYVPPNSTMNVSCQASCRMQCQLK